MFAISMAEHGSVSPLLSEDTVTAGTDAATFSRNEPNHTNERHKIQAPAAELAMHGLKLSQPMLTLSVCLEGVSSIDKAASTTVIRSSSSCAFSDES